MNDHQRAELLRQALTDEERALAVRALNTERNLLERLYPRDERFEVQVREIAHAMDLLGRRQPPVLCRECGEPDDAQYIEDVRDDMIARQLCYGCRFWLDWAASPRTDIVRANGRQYTIGPETGGYPRGHGGARFRFLTYDGRVIESTNVWTQGEIPARFRDRLPDNAELV